VEGYVESVATGLLAGLNAGRSAIGLPPVVPPIPTACGSLTHYISHAEPRHFQPANISFGLLPEVTGELKRRVRDRQERHRIQVADALTVMEEWIVSLARESGIVQCRTEP
jgi:methylenetetrahydrofolate--tRNA-(uracil-5-)-methyltransferase